MQVEFIKKRFYNGKEYDIGDIVEMNPTDYKIYEKYKAVKYHISIQKPKEIKDLSYKELQGLCKKYDLPAAGAKEKLIELIENYEKTKDNNIKN